GRLGSRVQLMHGWRVANHRRRRDYWVGLIAELEAGASVEEVARRHRVKEGTLKWWRTQIRREMREGGRLLPVVQRSDGTEARSSAAIEIRVGSVSVHVEPGTDERYVAALLSALRNAC